MFHLTGFTKCDNKTLLKRLFISLLLRNCGKEAVNTSLGQLFINYIIDSTLKFVQECVTVKMGSDPPKSDFLLFFYYQIFGNLQVLFQLSGLWRSNDPLIRINWCSKFAIFFGSTDFVPIKRMFQLSGVPVKRIPLYSDGSVELET